MKDLIDRQAAIDMAVSIPMFGRDVKMVAVSEIEQLPSAQSETAERTAETAQNVSDSDLISRKEAIDATWFEPSYTDPLNVLTEVRDRLKVLPSAHPEQLWIPVTVRLPKVLTCAAVVAFLMGIVTVAGIVVTLALCG